MSPHPRPPSRGEPPLPSIKVLGTSWYRRRTKYWLLRSGVTLVLLVLLGIFALYVTAIFSVVVSSTGGVTRVVLLAVCCAAVAFSFVAAIRARVRAGTAGAAPARSGIARAPGAGVAMGGGSPIGGLLLIVSALLGVGWLVVGVAVSLGRYLGPEEIAAVQGVERWRAEHHAPPTTGHRGTDDAAARPRQA